jgi:hypothetical protein
MRVYSIDFPHTAKKLETGDPFVKEYRIISVKSEPSLSFGSALYA